MTQSVNGEKVNKQQTIPYESDVLRFFSGQTVIDPRYLANYTIDDIKKFDSRKLENRDDWIQWAFPTIEESGFYSLAPTLTANDICLFKQAPKRVANLNELFSHVLDFYGLKEGDENGIYKITTKEKDLKENKIFNYLLTGSHNIPRLTRIMNSLEQLGFQEKAIALSSCLNSFYPHILGTRSISPFHMEMINETYTNYWNCSNNPNREIETDTTERVSLSSGFGIKKSDKPNTQSHSALCRSYHINKANYAATDQISDREFSQPTIGYGRKYSACGIV